MTAPRIARANRSRFFIGLGILVLTMGFVAIFHNSQQQLDELRHMEVRCEQQQEALSSQIAIAENSLKLERSHHQQTKHDLQKRTKDEKENRDKYVMESNLKFSSLQQHYKLLKSEHEDLTESCTKKAKQQMEETNGLQGKLKLIQSQNVQLIKEKDKEIGLLKAKIQELENEKHHLLKTNNQGNDMNGASADANILIIAKLKNDNNKLEKQIESIKVHCPWTGADDGNNNQPEVRGDEFTLTQQNPIEIEKYFNAQISVSENLYKIPIKIVNHTNRMPNNNNNNNNGAGGRNSKQVAGGVINSVENFQIVPNILLDNFEQKNILEAPAIANIGKNSTQSSVKMSEANHHNNNEQKLPNAPVPTAIPSSSKMKPSSTTETSIKKPKNGFLSIKHHRQVPEGVVPVPEDLNYMMNKNDDVSDNKNNRYSNVVNDLAAKKSSDKFNINPNELENGAREVNDNNDFLVDERSHKDHLQEVLDDNKLLGNNNVNNDAAEEDTNIYDKNFNLINKGNEKNSQQKMDKNLNSNRLLNEIDGDQGKVPAYPDDTHVEEQLEEEDDDEYSNPQARKQDPAVRN